MLSEPHVPGTDLGEVQLALTSRQFQALRDGARFFYLNDSALRWIWRRFHISYKVTLSQLIARNSDVPLATLPADSFFAPAPARATPVPLQ